MVVKTWLGIRLMGCLLFDIYRHSILIKKKRKNSVVRMVITCDLSRRRPCFLSNQMMKDVVRGVESQIDRLSIVPGQKYAVIAPRIDSELRSFCEILCQPMSRAESFSLLLSRPLRGLFHLFLTFPSISTSPLTRGHLRVKTTKSFIRSAFRVHGGAVFLGLKNAKI